MSFTDAAKIDIISESSKFFSNFICSSTKISTIFNTFNTNCINIVTIIRTITSFSNWLSVSLLNNV